MSKAFVVAAPVALYWLSGLPFAACVVLWGLLCLWRVRNRRSLRRLRFGAVSPPTADAVKGSTGWPTDIWVGGLATLIGARAFELGLESAAIGVNRVATALLYLASLTAAVAAVVTILEGVARMRSAPARQVRRQATL